MLSKNKSRFLRVLPMYLILDWDLIAFYRLPVLFYCTLFFQAHQYILLGNLQIFRLISHCLVKNQVILMGQKIKINFFQKILVSWKEQMAKNHDWTSIQKQKDIFIKIRMHLKIFPIISRNLQNTTNFHGDKNVYVRNHKLIKYSLILKLFWIFSI